MVNKEDSGWKWAHYRDLPEDELELVETGGEWSDRFASWWQVSDQFDCETVSVTVVELGPGEKTPMHAHKEPVEEIYVVLEGTVDIETPDEFIEGATPGTIAYFPPGVEHRPVNNYDEPTVELGVRALEGSVEAAKESIDLAESEIE